MMESQDYKPLDVLDGLAIWLAEYADGGYSDDTYMAAIAGKYAESFGHKEDS